MNPKTNRSHSSRNFVSHAPGERLKNFQAKHVNDPPAASRSTTPSETPASKTSGSASAAADTFASDVLSAETVSAANAYGKNPMRTWTELETLLEKHGPELSKNKQGAEFIGKEAVARSKQFFQGKLSAEDLYNFAQSRTCDAMMSNKHSPLSGLRNHLRQKGVIRSWVKFFPAFLQKPIRTGLVTFAAKGLAGLIPSLQSEWVQNLMANEGVKQATEELVKGLSEKNLHAGPLAEHVFRVAHEYAGKKELPPKQHLVADGLELLATAAGLASGPRAQNAVEALIKGAKFVRKLDPAALMNPFVNAAAEAKA